MKYWNILLIVALMSVSGYSQAGVGGVKRPPQVANMTHINTPVITHQAIVVSPAGNGAGISLT